MAYFHYILLYDAKVTILKYFFGLKKKTSEANFWKKLGMIVNTQH
jgi:hypothetical protein